MIGLFLSVFAFLCWRTIQRAKQSVSEGAQQILDQVRHNFSPRHEFARADPKDFDDVDLEFYERSHDRLLDLGFVVVADVEDRTVRETSGVRTFVRVMHHPKEHAVAACYWTAGFAIHEFETEFSAGSFVVTTNAPAEFAPLDWDQIHVAHFDPDTPLEELWAAHQKSVEAKQAVDPSLQPVRITTYEHVVAQQNRMYSLKHSELAKAGWVTKDYLAGLNGVDRKKARIVAAEIARILERERLAK